ncbi:MAG: lysozyme [Bryobacteraceae bacterium]|jgi:lysozyme
MRASPAATELIKRFESLELEAYLCPAGAWTIGWGHTGGVQPGMRITQSRAEELLGLDIEEVERNLPSVIHAPLTQGQHDALVSLCFNLKGGPRQLPKVAPKLVSKINSGDYAGAALEFLDINHAHGAMLPGLTRRREAERELFLS